jgi:hypothetical protein
MVNLNTTNYNIYYPSTQTYSTSNSFNIPVPTLMGPKPVSYDFRVAEYTNKDGSTAKVALQMMVTEHDQHGNGIVIKYWHDVERIKIPLEVPV